MWVLTLNQSHKETEALQGETWGGACRFQPKLNRTQQRGGIPSVCAAAILQCDSCLGRLTSPVSKASAHAHMHIHARHCPAYFLPSVLSLSLPNMRKHRTRAQVLNADREVLHDQLVASEAANERLTTQVWQGSSRKEGSVHSSVSDEGETALAAGCVRAEATDGVL